MKKEMKTLVGTIRIGKNLKFYTKTLTGWKQTKQDFPKLIEIVKLFISNNKFEELIDKKNPNFLKGQLYKDKIQGARINILPNGEKLDGAYSLFAPELTVHDQLTHLHWDLIYKNPNGKFAYRYTLEKKGKSTDKKYKTVEEFERLYPSLNKTVLKAIDEDDYMALPVYTLLKTYMRVGNEIYYKSHGHKGLTTLKKEDVKISGNYVNFKYLGKDGVPQDITKEFPETYIRKLKHLLSKTKSKDFIFKNKTDKLLHENDFKESFKRYIGRGFYPHIVRSFFATKQTQEFLKRHKNPDKIQVKSFLIEVAEELGHKKFSNKTNNWEDSYSVTIGHYINPKLVEKLRKFLKR